jgi:hypothetical protein
MANGSVMSMLNGPVNIQERSKAFARSARKARRRLRLQLDYLSDLTCIEVERLRQLEGGGVVFRSSELQLLGVILGIGLDELFPVPHSLSPQDIHSIFKSLFGQNIGLIAGTAGQKAEELAMNQASFERSVVQLHYCAECLAQFPS